MLYSEDKHINALIDRAKARADSVRKQEIATIDDLIWSLKKWWSKRYSRPLKDPLLESYDLSELLFEFFLFTEVDETEETNKIISDHKEELADLFKDLAPPSQAEVSQEEQAFLEKEWSMTENDFK